MQAITGAKIITVADGTLDKGVITIENGKILSVGENLDVPDDATVMDADGLWVTPGLIDAHTHLCALNEPQAGAPMFDGEELSEPIQPYLRVIDCINPFDMGITEVRRAGFTTCCTMPGSGTCIGGQGIVMKTRDGTTMYDLIMPGTEVMKFALGENPRRTFGEKGRFPGTRMGVAAVIREALFNAKQYAETAIQGKRDFRLEPLVPVLREQMLCRFHAHRADDIVTASRIAEEFGLNYCVEHATEAWKIVDYIQEHHIRCVLGPLNMDPSKMEVWEMKLETPGILEKAGIEFCLTQDASSATKYFRNHIGMCVARGLSWKTAMESVTINPARLLVIDSHVGSIEPGKDADIAFFDGDPFSSMTLCRGVMIDGEWYT